MAIAYPKPETLPGAGTSLRQFDSVRLLEDLPAGAVLFLDEGIKASVVAAGATGAIVDVHDDKQGVYEVELTDPVPALATLGRHQIERL